MKKLYLSILLLFLPILASADSVEIDGIYYIIEYDKKTAYVTSMPSDHYSGDIIIPEIISYEGEIYDVNSIDYRAFGDCKEMTSVSIPKSVKRIGSAAFSGCQGLTSIIIPNSVTSIGDLAFEGCKGLTFIDIPNSVISIGGWVFNHTAWYNNLPDGLVYAGKVAYRYKGEMPANTNLIFEEGTLSIADHAFSGQKGLTSITLPNSLISIGSYAFHNCSNLGSFSIPNSVTSIGEEAFYKCSSLTSVTFPNSLTSIGSYAFAYCSSLASISIPNSVTSFGSEAFYRTLWYNNQPDGLIYAGNFAYKYKGEMPANTHITIKDGTIGIAGRAFNSCKGLTSVTFPNSVSFIDEYAFSGHNNMKSVCIGNNVKYIGPYAFSNCHGLTSVTIPNSVKSMGNYVFRECRDLTSVTIPCNMKSIPSSTFESCFSLTSVSIPDGVLCIGSYAFGNSGLKSVIIPYSIITIENGAFRDCNALTDVYCYADNVPMTNSYIYISSYAYANATLHVPASLLELYRSSEHWRTFKNIVALTDDDPKPTGISEVKVTKNDDDIYYDLSGRKVIPNQKGVYFHKGKKQLIK